ncbi:MAG: hypothetical protein AAGA66_10240 [Bacteroidota bacterium]
MKTAADTFSVGRNGNLIIQIDTGLGPIKDNRSIEEYLNDRYEKASYLEDFLG